MQNLEAKILIPVKEGAGRVPKHPYVLLHSSLNLKKRVLRKSWKMIMATVTVTMDSTKINSQLKVMLTYLSTTASSSGIMVFLVTCSLSLMCEVSSLGMHAHTMYIEISL